MKRLICILSVMLMGCGAGGSRDALSSVRYDESKLPQFTQLYVPERELYGGQKVSLLDRVQRFTELTNQNDHVVPGVHRFDVLERINFTTVSAGRGRTWDCDYRYHHSVNVLWLQVVDDQLVRHTIEFTPEEINGMLRSAKYKKLGEQLFDRWKELGDPYMRFIDEKQKGHVIDFGK